MTGLRHTLRLRQRLLRWIFSTTTIGSALIAGVTAPTVNDAWADESMSRRDHNRFGVSVLVMEEAAEPVWPGESEQWCGWGTHDSVLDVRHQQATESPDFRGQIAKVASQVRARVEVTVREYLEPFVAVGPAGTSHWSELQAFAKHFTESLENEHEVPQSIDADSIAADITPHHDVDFGIVSFVPFVDFDGKINCSFFAPSAPWEVAETREQELVKSGEAILADWQSHDAGTLEVVASEAVIRLQRDTLGLQEPIDVDQRGHQAEVSFASDTAAAESAAVSNKTQKAGSRQDIAAIASHQRSRLIGASSVVATIEEVYLPYDLAARDLKLRNLFPLESASFCLLQRAELKGFDQESLDDQRNGATVALATPKSNRHLAAPECLWDELVWNVSDQLGRQSSLRRSLRPRRLGKQLAHLSSIGARSTSQGAAALIARWTPSTDECPPTETIADSPLAAPTASKRLLARAEAVEGPLPMAPAQQAPLREWVTNWFRATDTIQHWFRVATSRSNDPVLLR